ncbi:tRNA dihydrouridine synthase DusB [Candidatus Peregrinibacteria bacterium]|nr:tRNA dihydrouridine synthase DusB [Candidatus Peregrinibacteria bacterium]
MPSKKSFSWDALPRPIIALAPMSGYTDSPFRQLVKEICPSVVCFTEFTNIEGLLHANAGSLRQISFHSEKERPIIAQLFGNKPERFKKAAEALTAIGVDAIDLNMGCPARKVVSADHGSALLKNCALSQEIIKATIEGAPLPVSVKMRIGTTKYDPDYFFKFAKSVEDCGAKLITIHGRTAKQMYTGEADWEPIYELKKILKIPVIGNGDIRSGSDAVNKIKNLDGIMVGRATFGNPWIFAEIKAAFDGKKFKPLSLKEKLPTILRHLDLSCEFKGEKWGILEMRKHLAWYIRGIPHASEFRRKLVNVNSKDEAVAILSTLLRQVSEE